MSKKNSSHLLTKTIQKALENAPVTTMDNVVYHYNFRTSRYVLANPNLLKPPPNFPFNKMRLVKKKIQNPPKNFFSDKPRYSK